MAVDGDDLFAFLGIADVDEGLTQSLLEIIVHDGRGLADADGVIVNSGSDANHSGVIPDAVGHAVLGCPLILIVPAGVGIGAEDVHLTGGQTGEGTAVGVRLHRVGQVGDILVEVLLEPQRGVDVSGRRGGIGHTPVGTAHVLPGEGLASVDLGGQLLALLRGTGDHQGTVAGDLLSGRLGGGVVVPVLGIIGVNGQAVTGGGQQHVAAVIVEHIGAAGDQAHIGGTGGQSLAHCLIAGAHGDVHLANIVPQRRQFIGEHLLQGFGSGNDFLWFAGRDKSDPQGINLFVAGFRSRCGTCAAVCGTCAAGAALGLAVLAAAASQQANTHHTSQQERKCFFHSVILLVVSVNVSGVTIKFICYRGNAL